MTPVTLASASASRAAMLRAAGVAFEAVAPPADEQAAKAKLVAGGAGPRAVAAALAQFKAEAVSAGRAGLVIGADQTLDLDGALIDKPATLAQADQRLRQLRGREHALHAAAVLIRDGRLLWSETQTAQLTMRNFSDDFLDGYLARQGAAILASSGAYLLESEGVQLFERIDGDYFAILGLPLLGLLGALRRAGGLAA